MRSGVISAVLVLFGCGSRAAAPPVSQAPRTATDASELVCPPPGQQRPRSSHATLPVERGGYRRLPDQTALGTFRHAVSSARRATQAEVQAASGDRASAAFMAAVADMRPELRACIEKADTVVPDLQYTLRVQSYGAPTVGTVVQKVTFKRIAGVNGTAPVEASTDAEVCVADLVSRLELPPSNGLSEMLTIYRYDECTPKAAKPERDIESWNTHGITRE